MTERMSWKDDEKLYQPRVHSKRIRELHKIAEETRQPMTVLIDLALRKFISEKASLPYSEVSSQNSDFEAKG